MRSTTQYVYKTTLAKTYGLTPKLIALLGPADKEVPNRHHRSGPPSLLYAVDRVEQFVTEHAAEVADAASRRKARSESAARGVVTKTTKLIDGIDEIGLTWSELPRKYQTLLDRAASHAVARYGAAAHTPGYAGVVATVRHEFTNYDELLRLIHGKVGSSAAYESIRSRLDDEIEAKLAERYPRVLHDAAE
jgi:hypothetical protein